MAVQNGKDLLVKMDMTGAGNFETIAGLRATRLSFNAQTVDVTSLNSQGGWRELLAGAGVKAASVSGSGVFRDAATDERARAVFFNGEIPVFQVVVPDFGIMEGPFQISGIEYAGSYNGEATYELTLVSAGVVAFTPMTAVVPGGGDPEDGEGGPGGEGEGEGGEGEGGEGEGAGEGEGGEGEGGGE